MSITRHHPKTETLAAYAAGALDEARSVVIATHAAQCGQCRQAIRDFEVLGGACLEEDAPVEMRANTLQSFWARAGAQNISPIDHAATAPVQVANDLEPAATPPLSAYLKGGVDNVTWRTVAPGISQHIIKARGFRDGALRLLRIAPGASVARHTHGEEELTLVLKGAYEDEIGAFAPGDLADLDNDVTHAPRAIGDEACICIVAINAPLKFKDLSGRLLQPIVGI